MPIKKDILIDKYIEALEGGTIPWEKGWNSSRPHNPITGTVYNGLNRLWLTYVSQMKGYKDSRWFTFNEIIDKNQKYHPDEKWKLKKGCEGVEISKKPSYYNEQEDKYYSSRQYYKKLATLDDIEKEIFKESCKQIWNNKDILYIYNAEEIEGISPEQSIKINPMTVDKMNNIIKNMGVKYVELLDDRSYYLPSLDKVVTPPKERFKDESSYFSTLLHELAHATGHESRLNRDLTGKFGSNSYAREELRADIGAAFVMADFGLEFDEKHVKNHLAYVQSWARDLKDNKAILQEAIKDAELINNYITEMARGNELSITAYMDNTAIDIDDYHIAIQSRDEGGVDYTVFDKGYKLLDGGVIELGINDLLGVNDFIEFIDNKKFNIDRDNFLFNRTDYSNLMDKVDKRIALDEKFSRTFTVEQNGYYVSNILDNGKIEMSPHEDHRMYFNEKEADRLVDNIPMASKNDNADFIDTLKSNILNEAQTTSEVKEIYKEPDMNNLKTLGISKSEMQLPKKRLGRGI